MLIDKESAYWYFADNGVTIYRDSNGILWFLQRCGRQVMQRIVYPYYGGAIPLTSARSNHEYNMVPETYLGGDGKDERYDKHCLDQQFMRERTESTGVRGSIPLVSGINHPSQ